MAHLIPPNLWYRGVAGIQRKGLLTELDDCIGRQQDQSCVEEQAAHESGSRLHGVNGENEEIQTHFGAALHRHTWMIDTLIRVCCLQRATFLILTPSSAKTYILRWLQEGWVVDSKSRTCLQGDFPRRLLMALMVVGAEQLWDATLLLKVKCKCKLKFRRETDSMQRDHSLYSCRPFQQVYELFGGLHKNFTGFAVD